LRKATAVRTLKSEPWPTGLLAQTTLDLFYAQCLVQYERAYSWQIGTREKIESSGPVDLKAWTRAQIVGEAEKAFRRAWARRADLGALPVGALGEYVDPNNYPKDVRGAAHAVSYLFAQMLADSSLWTPAQSNDVYQLDVRALLASEGRDADAKLADEAAHPLEKFVAVLGDLESWHGAEGRLAAELEARLERSRGLHAAFTEETVRALIRKDLEARLSRFRSVPWWSWEWRSRRVPPGRGRARQPRSGPRGGSRRPARTRSLRWDAGERDRGGHRSARLPARRDDLGRATAGRSR
jgi:hypothetical protein